MKKIIFIFVSMIVYMATIVPCFAHLSKSTSNHSFDHVEMGYSHNECSFTYSPVSFCDERHISEIKNAIAEEVPNFDEHYIILKIKEWGDLDYYGYSVVVIDVRTGVVYPMPFDYFSDRVGAAGSVADKIKKLVFSTKNNKICINGAILVYRATTSGKFCFYFDGSKFTGYRTEYMY
jgi:hypothetical protein